MMLITGKYCVLQRGKSKASDGLVVRGGHSANIVLFCAHNPLRVKVSDGSFIQAAAFRRAIQVRPSCPLELL